MSGLALFRQLVEAQRAMYMDGESVESVDDYRAVIAELATLSRGALVIDAIECTEGEPRRIACRAGTEVHRADLQGDTDYIGRPCAVHPAESNLGCARGHRALLAGLRRSLRTGFRRAVRDA